MSAPTRRSLLLALPALLAGCSTLLQGKPPPKLYTLTPVREFPPGLPDVRAQVLVDVPVAPGAIDTERIALMKGEVSVDYFADAAWTDRAPLLVQSLLVESFENTGKIGAIGRDTATLRADYVLMPELRDFTAVYGNGAVPTVQVRLGLRLIRVDDRRIIGQHQVQASADASQDAIIPIVEAFDSALHKVMAETVAWTLTSVAHG
ncbi:MAG TPA: ABC-type transport auxiliary lipoprotein family protein [Stellaceae bacterium]|nr:ABC-type transport auxiliary lipoprotein family protein [Stellaceae bacterium]